ncbi:tetratricopeptide repeat protein, partial [Acidobacteriota bacterium]
AYDSKSPVLSAVDFLLGIKGEELRSLHTRRFEESLAHLLLFQGDSLRGLKEDKKALSAYSKSAELSPRYRDQIIVRLGNHGNNLYREEAYEQAIDYYTAALKLNPERIDLRFMRAEALSAIDSTTEAQREYLDIFGQEGLDEPVWEKLRQLNPLALIWRTEDRCFFLFRTQRGSFQGNIKAEKNIRDVHKYILLRRDRLSYKDDLLRFEFSGGRGVVKIFSFKLPPELGLNIDIRTDGQRRHENVIDLNKGTHPQSIPFKIK